MEETLQSFGSVLASLRARRKISQLNLSLDAGVSARHVSFLETGRANPSREMVLQLGRALDLSDHEQEHLLNAAGFLAPRSAFGLAAQGRSLVRDLTSPGHASLDAALTIEGAGVLDDAVDLAAAALARLGITHHLTGLIRPVSGWWPWSLGVGDTGHAPIGWLLHYQQRGFLGHDPVWDAALRAHRSFFWHDILPPADQLTGNLGAMAGEISDYGLRQLFVQPVRRADGSVHVLCGWGAEIAESDPSTRIGARLIAGALIERFERSDDGHRHGPLVASLTAQVRDCLAHILDGRSFDWIGHRLRLSPEEVERAVSSACLAFGTGEPVQAALRARRFELI